MNKTAKLCLEISFDAAVTDAEQIADALGTLMTNALSTPGILDEQGNPHIGTFEVLYEE
jgi:hypothetical protein